MKRTHTQTQTYTNTHIAAFYIWSTTPAYECAFYHPSVKIVKFEVGAKVLDMGRKKIILIRIQSHQGLRHVNVKKYQCHTLKVAECVCSHRKTFLIKWGAVCNPVPPTAPHTEQTAFPYAIWLGGDLPRRVMWLAEGQSDRSWQRLVCSRFSAQAGGGVMLPGGLVPPNQVGEALWSQPASVKVYTENILQALVSSNWDIISGICFSLWCDPMVI